MVDHVHVDAVQQLKDFNGKKLQFDCGQFDQPRLMADTDVICSDPGHEVRQYVAIAGISTKSLGTPLVFFMMLKHYGCALWLGRAVQDHHPQNPEPGPNGRDPEGIPPLG